MSTERSHDDTAAQKDRQQPKFDDEYETMKREQIQRQKQQAIVARRINMRILPFLYSIYTLALFGKYITRLFDLFGMGFAVYRGGLCDELLLDRGSIRFYTSAAIFYVPYCVFETPAKVLLQKLHPQIWLSLAVFLFGITTLVQGTIQSYGGLLATRFFLGVFELAIFAGIFYITGLWYTRSEAQYRHDTFFSFLPLVAAAYALMPVCADKAMDGLGGYAGWRWIFIFQGALAVVLSALMLLLLPGLPEASEWLSKEGKEIVASRRSYDPSRCIRIPPMSLDDISSTFKSTKVILGIIIYLCLVVHVYIRENISQTGTERSHFYKILAQIPDIPSWVVPIVFGVGIGPFSGFNSWH